FTNPPPCRHCPRGADPGWEQRPLSGVQPWVALPDRDRHMPALFQHVERVPIDEQRGGIVQVFAGSLSALASPATHHSGIFGGDVPVHPEPLTSRGEAERVTPEPVNAAVPWLV